VSTASDSPIANRKSQIENLLSRPPADRLRESKYRFGQSIVFGLPVIALQLFADKLGPTDADRWSSLLQSLLAGWVLYVNLGPLAESALLRRPTADGVVCGLGLSIYLFSLISAAHGILTGRLWWRTFFDVMVALLGVWSAWRWMRLNVNAAHEDP